MNLFEQGGNNQTQQDYPALEPAPIDYSVKAIAASDTSMPFGVQAVQPLTFRDAGVIIKKISFHKAIKSLMDSDTVFKNYIWTCLMMHIQTSSRRALDYSCIESECLVPDQYRFELGSMIVIESRGYDHYGIMVVE